MSSRLIWSVALLLLLVIGVFSEAPQNSVLETVVGQQEPERGVNINDIESLLQIARSWPGIAPYWTRESLRDACRVQGWPYTTSPVFGITGCSYDGSISGLNFPLNASLLPLPRLEMFETLAGLESFVSALPFPQDLPISWGTRLTKLRTISLTGTRILGGTIPESWSSMQQLKIFELEFSPIGDVFQYPGGAIPSWFSKLDTLKLAYVNFGAKATFDVVLEKVEVFNVTNCGWNYLLPTSIETGTNDRLRILSVTAPLAHSGGSSTPLPDRYVFLHKFQNLRTVELCNIPTITSCPSFPNNIGKIVLRNLQNMRGTFYSTIIGSSSLRSIEIVRCHQLSGNIPFPTYPANSNLESLIFRDTGFTGFLPVQVYRLPQLHTFIAAGLFKFPPMIVPTPSIPGTCNIKTLIMSNMQLNGGIPERISSMCTQLETLDLSYNQLSGTIPATWVSTNFKEFNVAVNRLSGNLPALRFSTTVPATSSLPGVSLLSVRSNQLAGTVPEAYFATKFRAFDVSNNVMNLCLNSVAIGQSALFSLRDGACALGPQHMSFCSCARSWPASCNPAHTC